jgi:hypothetical protein
MVADGQREILESGFAILPQVFSADEVAESVVGLDAGADVDDAVAQGFDDRRPKYRVV